MVLSPFLKKAISNFFRSNGLYVTQFDSERQFFYYLSRSFFPKKLFLSLVDRLESLLVTLQNVKNSPVSGDLMRPTNDL